MSGGATFPLGRKNRLSRKTISKTYLPFRTSSYGGSRRTRSRKRRSRTGRIYGKEEGRLYIVHADTNYLCAKQVVNVDFEEPGVVREGLELGRSTARKKAGFILSTLTRTTFVPNE
ncbi:hypothetical protein TNIN_61831 [Trichonephila inaurata madagascariensis]|uniref:Uncharacterized protein n=1 Tax=Trichonephila inaurata madagascariensis TaxID=2747483 RepID=A0A8X6YKA4_9ARAC|nr:hypothetical protein TNIN_61831 [Trichonephila inaurata madagascariensis]